MRRIASPIPFAYCQICGDPAGLITPGKRQFCGISCMSKGRQGMKTKPVCPICKGGSLHRDAAWWVCPNCKWKGVYPDRVEVKDDGNSE